MSVESNRRLRWSCFNSLCDWCRKLAALCQPIRCKIDTNHNLVARVFPRFRQFSFYFEFSLAPKSISFPLIGCCDYFCFVLQRSKVLQPGYEYFFASFIERKVSCKQLSRECLKFTRCI